MTTCRIQQLEIPPDLLGPLQEYTEDLADHQALEEAISQQGYVVLRAALDRPAVLAAREEVMTRLHEVGEIGTPPMDGIATGTSQRRETAGDLGEFWRSVNQGTALRAVTHGSQLNQLVESVLGEPARPHDLMYLRPVTVGNCTDLHYDYPFFAGSSERIHTAWIPLGDVSLADGPLAVVEDSQHFGDLLDPIREHDYQRDRSNEAIQQAAYGKQNQVHPLTFCRQRDTRLLSSDFQAGDVLIFSMFTLHGSLENNSTAGQVRLSCDVRYQPAADPATDGRYFGPSPTGSKGGGYADMRGARPLADS
ncbi:MAG: phytanoyl-CoA dioxygenase family protein [Pirellulaceae bacterium]